MAAALPLGKLIGVGLKQVSKPLASQLKRFCKNNELASSLTMGLGQRLHRFGVNLTRTSLGSDNSHKPVRRLSAEKALDRGAEFIGESFVFAIAAGVTSYEYLRAKEKEAKLNAEKAHRKAAKQKRMEDDARARDDKIAALEAAIRDLQERLLRAPPPAAVASSTHDT